MFFVIYDMFEITNLLCLGKVSVKNEANRLVSDQSLRIETFSLVFVGEEGCIVSKLTMKENK